jgi:hypothetical protein
MRANLDSTGPQQCKGVVWSSFESFARNSGSGKRSLSKYSGLPAGLRPPQGRNFQMFMQADLRFATAITSMKAYLKPHRQWIESVLGCAESDPVTLELETPFGQFAAAEMLSGASPDRQCRVAADALRHSVVRCPCPLNSAAQRLSPHQPDSPPQSRSPVHIKRNSLRLSQEGRARRSVARRA